MKSLLNAAAIAIAVVLGFTSCDKATQKLHLGDKVVVKLTATQGIVWLRMRPFRDEMYYIRVPGKDSERRRDEYHYYYSHMFEGEPDWHVEGPYDEADLQLVSR